MKVRFNILLVMALLLLTSCGSKQEEVSLVSYGAELFDPGISYDEWIGGCAGDTDGQVYLAVSQINEEDFDRHCFVYRISEDGMPHLFIAGDDYLKEENSNIMVVVKTLQTGEDNSLWMTGSSVGDRQTHDFLWHVDKDGNELERFNLTKIKEELTAEKIDCAIMDSSKWLYLVSGDSVFALNHWQKYQFTLDAGGNAVPVRFGDGRIGFLVADGETAEMRTIDQDAQNWGEAYQLPLECSAAYPGNREYLFFCTSGGVLYGWNVESEVLVPLLDWLDTGISAAALLGFSIQEDGKIIGAVHENNTAQIAVLIPGAEDVEKTVLTLAGISGNYYLDKYVAEFNRTSAACRIVYKTYYTQTGDWFSIGEYLQARQRMMTEIGAGNIPDLLDVKRLPFQRYGALGMLEDLWPYIENDPELGRDGVMEHVLECAEQDGKLYIVFNSFGMSGAIGAKAAVGDRLGWTFGELQATLETMPEGCTVFWPETTKLELLDSMISAHLDSYIDWETGTCAFDSEEFKDILIFCDGAGVDSEVGDKSEWYGSYALSDERWRINTLLPERKMMLMETGIGNFLDVQRFERLFCEPVSFIGLPTRDGKCGSMFSLYIPAAMTTACKDKEGAWEFLRLVLLTQEPFDFYNSCFPVSRKGFEELREISMTPIYTEDGREKEKGIEGGYGLSSDEILYYYAATQEQYEQVMELYNAIDTIYRKDHDLWNIVSEQAQAYFVGDKSVDEVAQLIQQRAELYVSERL